MAGKARTWIWIVAGIVVLGILAVIAMAGAGFYFFSQHFDTRAASPAAAAREFDGVRARFQGRKPLIELDDRGRLLRTNPDVPVEEHVEPPHMLHVLAFEPDSRRGEGRIVAVQIPFWVLRFRAGNTRIDLNGRRMDLEDLKLTIEDLERLGPALIIDHTAADGDRVLVWSQ